MEISRTASYHVWESADRARLIARWSYVPATRALLFVHGLGSGWDVWQPFRELLERPEMSDTDVFFFDYQSLGATVPRCALRLREAIGELLTETAPMRNHYSRPKRASALYERVDIISHSLGSVVARTALVDLANGLPGGSDVPWKVRQLLLAPALLGSKLPLLMAGVVSESLFAALQLVRNGGFSAIMDLKEGSDLLRRLEARVTEGLKEVPVAARSCGLRVDRTAHGEDDAIVVQGGYARDSNYMLRPGSHFSLIPNAVSSDDDFVLGRANE